MRRLEGGVVERGAVWQMKVWPFRAAFREEALNHHMLRWLKTVVVSDVEKASLRRQVGNRKTIVVDASLLNQVASKPERLFGSGMSLAAARLLARWCPAWRRREPVLRLRDGTWEGHRRQCRRSCRCGRGRQGVSQAGRTCEGLSTVAWMAGGPVRSSVDASVMGAERRGRVVCGRFVRSTGGVAGGTVWAG